MNVRLLSRDKSMMILLETTWLSGVVAKERLPKMGKKSLLRHRPWTLPSGFDRSGCRVRRGSMRDAQVARSPLAAMRAAFVVLVFPALPNNRIGTADTAEKARFASYIAKFAISCGEIVEKGLKTRRLCKKRCFCQTSKKFRLTAFYRYSNAAGEQKHHKYLCLQGI